MATKELVTKIWIEEGCIVCDACETASPEVFEVQEETCVIRPEAADPEFNKKLTESIIEAAEECPTDVIKYEVVTAEVPDNEVSGDEAAAASSPADAAEPAPPTAEKSPVAAAASADPAPAAPKKPPTAPPKVKTAHESDPALQTLMRAATTRGGVAGISKIQGVPGSPEAEWKAKPYEQLPPDARQVRVMEADKKVKAGPSRRAMLSTSAAVGAGWISFGGAAALGFGPMFTRFMMPNALEEPDPKVRVGSLTRYREMVPGSVNEDYKPQGIWIIRTEESVAALSIICTHLGCIPNWLANDRKFKCPCHGSGYYPSGINFEGPAPRPLERFKISLVDGIVIVDKSKKFQYELGQWDNPEAFIPV